MLSALAGTCSGQNRDGIGTRLGLLNNNPLGTGGSNGASRPQQFVSTEAPSSPAAGRTPIGGQQQCCCVPPNQSCDQGFGGPDLVGSGLIDPRINRTLIGGIGTRIVNKPSSRPTPVTSCPTNLRTCCYDNVDDFSGFQRSCVTPQQANQQQQGVWRQQCSESSTGQFFIQNNKNKFKACASEI